MKRGAIEIQFNWIFILILGALILAFFFTLVQKQKSSSDTKIAVSARRDLRTIFTGAIVTLGKTTSIDLQNTEITFDCQGYSIGGLSPVRQGIMFAPDRIGGTAVTTTSRRFVSPYTAADILLLTSPEVRYIFAGDSNAILEINRSLPATTIREDNREKPLLTKEIAPLSGNAFDPQLEDKNNYKVRVVFFDHDPATIIPASFANIKTDNRDVTAINIKPDPSCTDPLSCFGTVDYYTKQSAGFQLDGSTYYFGKASVLGAIFADSVDLYNCNMREVFERFTFATEVYHDRTQKLNDHYTNELSHFCIAAMDAATDRLQTIKSSTTTLTDTFPPATITDLATIHQNADELRDFNEQAIKQSCAEIY